MSRPVDELLLLRVPVANLLQMVVAVDQAASGLSQPVISNAVHVRAPGVFYIKMLLIIGTNTVWCNIKTRWLKILRIYIGGVTFIVATADQEFFAWVPHHDGLFLTGQVQSLNSETFHKCCFTLRNLSL